MPLPSLGASKGMATSVLEWGRHPGAPSGGDDTAYSWSLSYFHSPLPVDRNGKYLTSYEGYRDNQLPEGDIADDAVSTLHEIKQNNSVEITYHSSLQLAITNIICHFRPLPNTMISIHQLTILILKKP